MSDDLTADERTALRRWLDAPIVDNLLSRLDHPGRPDRIGHDMSVLCADAAAALRSERHRADQIENGASILSDQRDDWRGRAERVMAERDHLVAIVRDLAAVPDLKLQDSEYGWCRVCQEWPHDESCPALRAREWTETHP